MANGLQPKASNANRTARETRNSFVLTTELPPHWLFLSYIVDDSCQGVTSHNARWRDLNLALFSVFKAFLFAIRDLGKDHKLKNSHVSSHIMDITRQVVAAATRRRGKCGAAGVFLMMRRLGPYARLRASMTVVP